MSCTGIGKNVSHENKTAVLNIQSTGIKEKVKKDKNLVLYFIQYSIDGNLIQAHQIKEDFNKHINVTPGRHNLFVEYAHRGMLSARALLQKEGDCYTFSVLDGQTATFEGRAVTEDKWEAVGFSGDIKSSMKKCSLKECQKP
jgi:hypothetical protein